MPRAEWLIDQPAFLSQEQLPGDQSGGLLAIDYTDGCDTRWRDQLVLGPLVANIDCSGLGGTTAVAGSGCIAPSTMNGTLGALVYMNRGTDPAKIKLSDMSVIDSGISLAEAGTSMIYTKSANGTEEISIGMKATAYQVIGTVGNTTDTASANNESYKIAIFGYAGSDPNSDTGQIAGLGRGTGTVDNLIAQNVLSGSVTMDASNWQQRAILAGESVTFTGFAVDGRAWVLGTIVGPYYLNADFRRFVKLFPELARDASNCRGMGTWSVYNGFTFIPLQRSLRTSKNVSYGQSVGVETFRENRSPVQGQHTFTWFSERWGYTPVYNPVTDKTYICAFRPRQSGDWHQNEMSYYPIITLADGVECNFGIYTGTEGGRTLPAHVFGRDSDAAYFSEARLDTFPSDTSYAYASSGSAYLTEMRRFPDMLKRPTKFWFWAENLSATQTITVTIRTDSSSTAQPPSWVFTSAKDGTSAGWCSVELGREEGASVSGHRLQPVITLATGSSTASPRITGRFYMEYETEEAKYA